MPPGTKSSRGISIQVPQSKYSLSADVRYWQEADKSDAPTQIQAARSSSTLWLVIDAEVAALPLPFRSTNVANFLDAFGEKPSVKKNNR
jgi:hypothetical protein